MRQETERQKFAESNQLGVSQAFELGERSNRECVFAYALPESSLTSYSTRRERISIIERSILKLASKLELSVGRPPSFKDEDVE